MNSFIKNNQDNTYKDDKIYEKLNNSYNKLNEGMILDCEDIVDAIEYETDVNNSNKKSEKIEKYKKNSSVYNNILNEKEFKDILKKEDENYFSDENDSFESLVYISPLVDKNEKLNTHDDIINKNKILWLD